MWKIELLRIFILSFSPIFRYILCYRYIVIISPEQKYKNIEKKIVELLEESILASTGGKPDVIGGLAKAKEASSMDRTLLRMRNQNGGNFTHNFDLTYSVSVEFFSRR